MTDTEWLARVARDWNSVDLVSPPSWVVARAQRLFDAHAIAPPSVAQRLMERIQAALVLDTHAGGLRPHLAGTRAAAAPIRQDAPRQLLFGADDVDLDLFIRPGSDAQSAHLRGQALAGDTSTSVSGSVEIEPAGNQRHLVPRRAALDPSGEFVIENLRRGRYVVRLRLDSREIELPPLEV